MASKRKKRGLERNSGLNMTTFLVVKMAPGSRPPRVAELAVWGAQPTQDIRLAPTWHHWAPRYLGKVGTGGRNPRLGLCKVSL